MEEHRASNRERERMRLLHVVSIVLDFDKRCRAYYLHRSETTTVAGVLRGHAHTGAKDWWRRSRAVRSASRAGVVLRTSPTQANTRIADGVALHLVDGHLRGMTLHELDETASLAWRNLDVGNLTEALEERTQLILGDIARQTTNEDSGVVGVGKLVHGLGGAIVAHRRRTHGVHAHARATAALLHAHTAGSTRSTALVLWSGSADAHGAVAAVNTLHLGEGLLLVLLVCEANETVTTRHAANGVGHDLGGLGRGVLVLEELDKDKLSDFRSKVTNEDRVLRAALIAAAILSALQGYRAHRRNSPAISKATARGPVELEGAVRVGDELAVETKGLGRGIGAGEIDKAIASVTAARISLENTTPLIRPLTPKTCRGSS